MTTVRVATTINGTLATDFANGQIIDGITLVTNDIILIKNQTNAVDNGIYLVTVGAPTRTQTFRNGVAISELIVYVIEGDRNAWTQWQCTNLSGNDIVGTNNLMFELISVRNPLGGVSIDLHCGGTGSTGATGPAPPFTGDYLQYNQATSSWENQPGLWDDIRTPITATNRQGSNDPTFSRLLTNGAGSQGVFAYFFDPNTEEELYFTVQIPHSYEEGTPLYPHVHFVPTTNGAGVVRWGLEYSWANVNSVFPNTTIIFGNATIAINSLNLQQVQGFDIPTDGIVGTGMLISSMLICRVFRDSTNAADTYTGDAALLEIDFHFQQCGTGSRRTFFK